MTNAGRVRLRTAAGWLFIILGLGHSLYYLVGILGNWEKDLWNAGQIAAGLITVLMGMWILRWRTRSFTRRETQLLRAVQLIFILGLAGVLIIEAIIWTGGRSDERRQTDYVLVLGARVRGDTVSLSLKDRLEKALAYYQAYPKVMVIVSGGKGPGEAVSEAEAMTRYLIEKGVPSDHILQENRSASTYENVRDTRELLKSKGIKPEEATFTLVTNDFHLYRSKWLAKREGLRVYGLAAPTPVFTIPKAYVRELAAVCKTWILGR